MNPGPALMRTEYPLPVHSRGKVRDTYVLDEERLLMVATDRLSAFDHVLPNGIPDRGKVLTQLSVFWFTQTHDFQENHLVSGMVPDLPSVLGPWIEELGGRFMIVKKAERIDFECVVRGYLAGSAWAEYAQSGTLAGEPLPAGLRESEKLPTPVFSPATKAATGHDLNVPFATLRDALGSELAEDLRERSLRLYRSAAETAEKRGLVLADTKFEFGRIDGRVVLIDEALTPDSSRYWRAEGHRPGAAPESYDKQFVRDWLLRSGWDRESDPPALPEDIVAQTRERYLAAYQLLVGQPLFPPPEKRGWLG